MYQKIGKAKIFARSRIQSAGVRACKILGETDLLAKAGEEELAGRGLVDFGDDDGHILPHEEPRTINDNHGPVGEVPYSLLPLLSLVGDFEGEILTRDDGHFEGLGQIIDIEHFDALGAGVLGQVKIHGHKFRLPAFGKRYQLMIHFGSLIDVIIDYFYFHRRVCLLALELAHNFQPPPALGPPDSVRTIGDVLDFTQDHARDDQCPHDEAAVDYGKDPSID